MKPIIDSNNEKWEIIRKKRAESGKQGGAPIGNKNASKQNNQNNHLLVIQSKQAVNVNVNDNVNDDDNVTDGVYSSSSIFYEDIKELAKKHGFNLNENQAQNFINRLEPSLLAGKFNFIDYAAEKVKNSGKPEEDHIKLFIKACEQEFFIDEFPEWRKNKEEETAAEEKRQQEEAEEQERLNRINQAKENYPETCDNCCASLAALEGLRGSCSSCGWDYSFNEEQESWEFYEHRSLTEEFKNII